MMRWQEYPDREMMFLALANTIAGDLADFLRRDGHALTRCRGWISTGAMSRCF
jgi:6-phosphogluconolactonase